MATTTRVGGSPSMRTLPSFPVRRTNAWQVLEGGARGDGWLTAPEAEAVLRAYGVPFAECRRVETPGEAVTAANDLGFPVVLKVSSTTITHKSDVGGVQLDLGSADEVRQAYEDMRRPFTDEHADRIRRYLADKPKGKFGKHRYTPEEWGFTAAELHEQLAPYIEHFGVALEE